MKKLLFILFIFLVLVTSGYSAKFNETFENLTLDNNGWCVGLPVVFTVYNETDYENKETIAADLCNSTEDPDEDDCYEWADLKGADVIVYGGPLESKGKLLETELDGNNQFSFTFDAEDGYLIEVEDEGDYNAYYDTFEVLSCPWINTEEEEENETNSTNTTNVSKIELSDQSFSYDNNVTIDVKDTIANDSANFTVETLVIEDTDLEKLENISKLIEVKGSNNYTSIDLKINITLVNDTAVKVYREVNGVWEEVEDFSQEDETVILESISYGIYAVLQQTEDAEDDEEISAEEITDSLEENQTQENEADSNLENEADTNQAPIEEVVIEPQLNDSFFKDKAIWIIGALVIGIILVIIIIRGSSNWKSREINKSGGVYKTTDPTKEDDVQHLHSMTSTYEKTKQYVSEYKKSYDKEQIRSALKTSNVPDDIIDKVFKEEYDN